MANLSNINNILRVSSSGVGINKNNTGPSELDIESAGADIIDMTRTNLKTYRFAISGASAFSLFDVAAGVDRLIIDSSGNSTFGGNATFAGNGVEITSTEVIITPNIATSAFVLNGQSRKYKMLNYSNQFYIQDFTVNAPSSTTRLMINGDGNIGIGTTSPDSKLDVTGGDITVNTSGIGFMNFKYGSVGSEGVIGNIQTDGIDLKINATSDLLLLPGSNVGIGTTSPLEKLNVAITTSTAGTFFPLAISGARYQADYGVGIAFRPENNSGAYANKTAIVGSGGGYGYNMADLHFCFNNDTSISTEVSLADAKVTMKRSGNVGIGTVSPFSGAELDVYGDIVLMEKNWALRGNNANADFAIEELSGSSFSDANIKFYIKSGGNVGINTTSPEQKLHVEGRGIFDGGTSSDILQIRNDNGGGVFGMTSGLFALDLASTSAFRIRQGSSVSFYLKSDGNVGIGYTNPSYKFQVLSNKAVSLNIGCYVNSQGPSTTNTAFYADASQGTSNNWAFYAASGNSYFANGIRLGGNGSSNELDDYEEGTWTPTSNLPGATVSSYGKYTKIGNIVYIAGKIEFTGKTGTAVNVVIDSLPFSGSNTSDTETRPSAFPEGDLVNMATLVNDYGHFRLNSNQMQGVIVNSSGNTIYMSSNNFSSSGQFNFSVVYTAT